MGTLPGDVDLGWECWRSIKETRVLIEMGSKVNPLGTLPENLGVRPCPAIEQSKH